MLKLLMLVVAGLAVASGEAEPTYSHELSNYQLTLHAGPQLERLSPEEPTERSVLISNRIKAFALDHIQSMSDPLNRDPNTFEMTSGTHTGLLYRLRLNTVNTEVRGISKTDLPELHFSLLRMNLNLVLKIPDIVVRTDYAAEVRLLTFVVNRASGEARLLARGIHVDGFMQLALTSDGNLQCTAMDLDLDIGHTNINVTEITGVGFLDMVINWIIQSVSANVVQDRLDELSSAISNGLLDVVNDVIGDFSLADLLG